MRSLPKAFALLPAVLAIVVYSPVSMAQTTDQPPEPTGGRVVLVLPFDNHSGDASLNWIGDSLPNTLNHRLNSAGFLTISYDDRVFAYQHLGLPADFRPTRATTIRIAQQLDASYVIIGSYDVQPGPATTSAAGAARNPANSHISIQARVLSIDKLRLSQPVEASAALTSLFMVENQIAWKVAGNLDPHFSVSEQTFLAQPGAVPLPAFEDYIRGINASSDAEKLQRLQDAVALQPNYPAALLALGKEQYAQGDFDAAAATLARIPATTRMALEANFYRGLAEFKSANYAKAQNAFAFVASRLPLPEVVNNQAVAMSRQGKDGVALFQKASALNPSDENYHYNLAIALFRRGNTTDSQSQVQEALRLKPGDHEAQELAAELKTAEPGTRLTEDLGGPAAQPDHPSRPQTDANLSPGSGQNADQQPGWADSGFSPLERIEKDYSETSFRQAEFQLDQMRAMRMALLPADQQAAEYTRIGRQYLAEGLLPEAEKQFQSALAANPNSADAHASMAQLQEAAGDSAKARDEARISLILKPNSTALMVLARLDMAEKQFAACAADIAQVLQLDPTDSQAIALRMVLQQQGQTVPSARQ
ncbi:MAG: tetratricopeptide repeat protein [Acidobacteriaceae bacterium]